MSNKHLAALTLVVTVLLVASVRANAAPVNTLHENGWKTWSDWSSCDFWNAEKQFRCAFNDGTRPTATIEIHNKTEFAVRLTYDEYHLAGSGCASGGSPIVREFYETKAKKSVTFDVLNGGNTIGCRVGYVYGCDQADATGKWTNLDVPCNTVVEVKYKLWKGNLQ